MSPRVESAPSASSCQTCADLKERLLYAMAVYPTASGRGREMLEHLRVQLTLHSHEHEPHAKVC